jgi:hypothetical protein
MKTQDPGVYLVVTVCIVVPVDDEFCEVAYALPISKTNPINTPAATGPHFQSDAV